MRTTFATIATALTLAVTGLAQTQQTSSPPKHKIVFQMNVASTDSWNQLLGNIRNAQTAFQKDGLQVEVVFYGKGLTALLKTNTEYEERLKQAAAGGVILAACQNTMRLRNIRSQDIFPFSTEVDSGVAELVRKQESGWAYIRAGE